MPINTPTIARNPNQIKMTPVVSLPIENQRPCHEGHEHAIDHRQWRSNEPKLEALIRESEHYSEDFTSSWTRIHVRPNGGNHGSYELGEKSLVISQRYEDADEVDHEVGSIVLTRDDLESILTFMDSLEETVDTDTEAKLAESAQSALADIPF